LPATQGTWYASTCGGHHKAMRLKSEFGWSTWFAALLPICAIVLSACGQQDDVPGVVRSADSGLNSLKTFERGGATFGPAQLLDSSVKAPRGIAAAGASLYVVGDSKLVRLDLDGKVLTTTELGAEPVCVAATPEGQVYVGLEDRVLSLTADGQRIALSPLGPRAHLTSISIGNGRLYVADAGNRLVHVYDGSGGRVASFGQKDPSTSYEGLTAPSPHMDVAALPDGTVLVVNPGSHKIETHGSDGKLLRRWGTANDKPDGFSGCCNPIDIAVFPDGRIVTAEKGLTRLKLYNGDGTYVGMIEKADVFPATTPGIDLAIDARGRVLAVEPSSHDIRVYPRESTEARKP
jgi:hypothetical protein